MVYIYKSYGVNRTKGYTKYMRFLYNIGINIIDNNSFYDACLNEDLDMAKWLYNGPFKNINIDYNFIFTFITCHNKKLDMVKWLYEIKRDEININTAFSYFCQIGNLELIKWLFTLDNKPDIHYQDDFPFRIVCSKNYFDIAKFLITLDDKPDIHARNDEAFRMICFNNNIDFAKWMFNLDNKPNIRENDDEAFITACTKNYIELSIWLSNLCDKYYIIIENDNKIISKWYIKDSIEELFKIKNYNELIEKLKIQKKDFYVLKNIIINNICCICFSYDHNFLSSCNHSYCLECFFTWYINHQKKECYYCMQNIDIEKCCVNIENI
jgi:hypothetical protein